MKLLGIGRRAKIDDHERVSERFDFDEDLYLAANPDVAAVVSSGETTAYAHYRDFGHREEQAGQRAPHRRGEPEAEIPPQVALPEPEPAPSAPAPSRHDRPAGLPMPSMLFDEGQYLSANPDVAARVAAGQTTAYAHYLGEGHKDEVAGIRPRHIPRSLETLEAFRDRDHESLIDRIVSLEMEKSAIMEAWDRHAPSINHIDYAMLSEQPNQDLIPLLDRIECDESKLDDDQLFWRRNGYIIKSGLIPERLLDAYAEVRSRHPRPGGWTCFAPYMHVKELRDVGLHPPLMRLMEKLIGEELGMMLNLTGWVSTDRNFHQDDYLNPSFVNSWYSAVWIALDDIHPDCGPFEFVPGSHRWDALRGNLVRLYLSADQRRDPQWPKTTERFLNDIVEDEIKRVGVEPVKFIAKKGDVLIWHGRLMHRGSNANVPGMIRKSLICHYTGINHSIDSPKFERTEDGSAYFWHDVMLDFDPYAVGA